MTRLLGFLIEGIGQGDEFRISVVVPDHIRDIAEGDLRTLDAPYGTAFSVHSPRDAGLPSEDMADLASFANEHVSVDGWLVLFPTFTSATLLKKPLTVIFPDAIPLLFHEFSEVAWGVDGEHVRWSRAVQDLLGRAKRVITFSQHVAESQVTGLFSIPTERIAIIPHAPPDLASLAAAFAGPADAQNEREAAARILRKHCKERGWTYLRDFPFEQVPFVAVSTQDRVTKNIQLVARALEIVIRERRRDAKLITTSGLHYGSAWTALPAVVEQRLIQFDVLSMPDLPRVVHAALLNCATLVIHPSVFEGGHAPFPFYEAISVGTPCLIARGPHTAEVAARHPRLLDFTFDPNDPDAVATMVIDVIEHRGEYLRAQQDIFATSEQRTWAQVARSYANVAIMGDEDERMSPDIRAVASEG